LENKRKDIPKEYLLLVDWYEWIKYDMFTSLSLELFCEYEVMLDWLTEELHEKFDIYETIGNEITQDNYMSFWFEFDRSFNKESILDMEADKKYEIKKRYGGYTMIELKHLNLVDNQ